MHVVTIPIGTARLAVILAAVLLLILQPWKRRHRSKQRRTWRARRQGRTPKRRTEKNQQSRALDPLRKVDRMKGPEFEQWCASLLRKRGFRNVQVRGGAGDQGVDVIAYKQGRKYAIQCKRYRSKLGNTPVQEINCGMEVVRADVGVVMTNSTFTDGAIEAAQCAGRDKPILLWDRTALRRMME